METKLEKALSDNINYGAEMIKKVGKKFYLYSHDGKKILGRHPNRAGVERQEAAVNISKARAAGHRIPRRPGKKG